MDILSFIIRFIIKYCKPQSEEECNSIVNSLFTDNNLILASFDYERLSTDLDNGLVSLIEGVMSSSLALNELKSKILLLRYLKEGIQQLSRYDKTVKDLPRFLLCSLILSSLLKELGLPSPFDEDPMNPNGINFGMGGK